MTLFPVIMDVYHKEQLVTKEEAEEVVSGVYSEEVGKEVGKKEVGTSCCHQGC